MFRIFSFSLLILFVMGCSNTAGYSMAMRKNLDSSCDFPAVEKEGALTRDLRQVTCVMNNNMSRIFGLYQRALRKTPDLSGEIVLRLEISPEGDIINIETVKSTINDLDLEKNIQLRVNRIKFPKIKGVYWTGEFPINFLSLAGT